MGSHAPINIGVCVATLGDTGARARATLGNRIKSLAVLEGGMLASGDRNTISIWDLTTGATVTTLKHPDFLPLEHPRYESVQLLAMLENGRLACGTCSGRIHIWDSALPDVRR